jgi:hypothetical protein
VRNICIAIFVALCCFAAGCQKKAKPVTPPPPSAPAAPAYQKTQFVPRADSTVLSSQARFWLLANPLLDSLAFLYQDSFKTPDAGLRFRYQTDLRKAQDLICVRCGLTGGYDEYLWVRSALGNPRNKVLLDSLRIARL